MSDFAASSSPSSFVAGLAPRHALAPGALAQAFAAPTGFAAVDPRARAMAPLAQPGYAPGPKHFSPASPGHKSTAGWDLRDPNPTEFDAIAAARAAGYAEGLAAASEDGARDAALVAGLGQALATGFDREAVAERLRATVLMLVGKLVGETEISADLLTLRIDAATELLAEPGESALLRVHPDDVALLEGRLPQSIFAAGDPHVVRGSFVLESASTVVEDGPALWLQQLAGAIDRIPVPKA